MDLQLSLAEAEAAKNMAESTFIGQAWRWDHEGSEEQLGRWNNRETQQQ
jgi:hypothetical protein